MVEKFLNLNWQGMSMLAVYHPGADRQAPGILFVHGLGGDRVDIRRLSVRLARRLQKQGIGSLRVDLLASGVSDGSFYKVTYKDQLEQLEYLLKTIRQQNLWLGPIIMLGFSQGATLAIAAARKNTEVKGICLWSGILKNASTQKTQQFQRIYRFDGEVVLNFHWGMWINQKLLRSLDQMSIHLSDDLPDIPMFGIYAGEDEIVLESIALLRGAGQPFIIIPDADHLFTHHSWETKLLTETENWVLNIFSSKG